MTTATPPDLREALADAFGKLRDLADDVRSGRHTPFVLAASIRAVAEEIRYADAPVLSENATLEARIKQVEAERDEGPSYGIIDPDYARVFTIARCLAWSEGYALMMHGSFTRDLDLLAVPWAETVCEPEHLARRVEDAAGLKLVSAEPGQKPHGRLAWTMMFSGFGDPRFVDFSVLPRPKDDAATARADALERAVTGLTALLLPIQRYAKVALRPEIDFGDGEIGEVIHGGLRHSLRTQDLRAIRDAALAQQEKADV